MNRQHMTETQQKQNGRLKPYAKNGVSLPLVICVGALLLAFSLAIIYTASLMMSNANQKLLEERTYQLAKSFAGVLDAELRAEHSMNGEVEDGTNSGGNSFQRFANQFLDKKVYNEYEQGNPNTVYHYQANAAELGIPADYGMVEVLLYKELSAGGNSGLADTLVGGEGGDYDEKIKNLKGSTFQRYVFVVEVVAKYEDLEYHYITEYYRKDSYDIHFTYDDATIVWVSGADGTTGEWKKENSAGSTVTPTGPITYTYQTDKLTSWEFVPVHEEISADTAEDAPEEGGTS